MDNKIDSQLQNYAEVFDFYIERGKLPPPYQGDMLAEYMKAVLDEPENQHIYQQDSTWREILKVSLLDFFNGLLPFFNTYDEKKREEQAYIGAFLHADIEGKRAMWFELEEYVSKTYSETAVNMNGYVQQLKEGKHEKEDIFQAMANDWKDAMDRRFENAKQNLLRINNKNFGIRMKEAGKEDYEMMNQTKRIFYKYPALKEILRLIGREKEENKEERDEVITRFLPFLISPNQSIEDIDGITIGNELRAILPSELSLLSNPNTEVLFYQKYASKQLQLFSNKPPTIKKEKKEVQKKITPRLIEGPIIVSIDTSGSMEGKPEQIAKSLLMQILQVAKRKKRKCFLITYSVRSITLEISKPRHWHKVKEFMKKGFTGGTDGEMMFSDALKALNGQVYSMADVLVISDFCFPYPIPSTEKNIKAEQQKGTKFYGIRIGNSKTYDKLFDKIWTI